MQPKGKQTNHIPVLLSETLLYLAPRPGETYLDVTAGYGGHAQAVLEQTKNPKGTTLIDRDQNAVEELAKLFSGKGAKIIKSDFYSASRKLADSNERFDMVLADLGASSPHLNTASRGFSFQKDAPLDMRMDQSQKLTAETIVNSYGEAELAGTLREYGEEPKANKIAGLIAHSRPIRTTTELAKIVAKAWPGHYRIHPATRTFQALRVAVNDEIRQLEASLPLWIELLNPGGRLAVISFHSLEDRRVKNVFNELGTGYDAVVKVLTKHPVTGDKKEIAFNPRARSAKLRAVAKIKIERVPHADSG